MNTYETALALGVFIPLLSFGVLAFWGHRLGKPGASFVAVAAIGISCLLSSYVLWGWQALDADTRQSLTENAYRFDWGELGTMPITVGVKLDSLTVIMFFMVTFVAFWIHFFSIGYMEGHSDEVDGQSKYHRFFAYLSLFSFSMLGLVVSSSLLFLFIFWELVGLCSYLLIGYYFDKKFASDAGIKAFITNRVGDFGFIVGLALVVLYLGTFDLDQAAATFDLAAHKAGAAVSSEPSAFTESWRAAADAAIVERVEEKAAAGTELFTSKFSLFGYGLATLMGIGLFCGAMGKSAQFPLHVWLPDAMAGPTPVSALIHAATMVAAGVYLVARVFRLLTPDAQMFIAVIGCITLTITALIAIVQTDIKKVLAYSTLSQLGYMIFGLGVGAWVAALFHLMTHAFFKAMLFLGSGQVIEGCHHEQDITKMGGLRKKMPVTCWTFFIGVLAIAGFGIPGMHLGLGGYFSKDEILAVAYERAFNWTGEEQGEPATEGEQHANVKGIENVELRRESAESVGTVRLASTASAPLYTFSILNSPSAATQEDAAHGDSDASHGETGTPAKKAIAATQPMLPVWMFGLSILIAYVTPFYMMRCWWLTFCGRPRDHHVYDHAHENWKMYVPLVVLAAGTVWCSYFLFRPMLADAAARASDSAAVVAIDGEAHDVQEAGGGAMLTLTHEAGRNPHTALITIVGFAWVIGMGVAVLIYRRGLATAERLRRSFGFVHRALERKLFFDDIYDNVLKGGTIVLGYVVRLFDNLFIDGAVNLAGFFTRAVGSFTGRHLDMPVRRGDFGLVDGIANGMAGIMLDLGMEVRRPQTGRIRNYVAWAAGAVAVALLVALFFDDITGALKSIMPIGEALVRQ